MPTPSNVQTIHAAAAQFRQRFVGNVFGPLDVEWLIEGALDMVIVPTPNMLARTGARAWLGNSGRVIHIDEAYYKLFPDEVRETLLHEAGHATLHRHLLPHHAFEDLEHFERFHENLDPMVEEIAETEARLFADLVLVPTRYLSVIIELEARKHLTSSQRLVQYATHPEAFERMLAKRVAARFGVSVSLASRRLRTERSLETVSAVASLRSTARMIQWAQA